MNSDGRKGLYVACKFPQADRTFVRRNGLFFVTLNARRRYISDFGSKYIRNKTIVPLVTIVQLNSSKSATFILVNFGKIKKILSTTT